MKTYAISLRDSPRREHIRSQLRNTGLDWRLVDAVDGRTLDGEGWDRLVDQHAHAAAPNWLTPTAVGCTLSHIAAYKEILAGSERCALVVEDDAVLPQDIEELCEAVACSLPVGDVALMYYRGWGRCEFRSLGLRLPNGRQLVQPVDVARILSGVAYVISRVAAERITEQNLPVTVASDSWGHFVSTAAVSGLYAVYPRPVSHSPWFQSDIDYMPKGSSLRTRLYRRLRNTDLPPVPRIRAAARATRERRMSQFYLT